MSLSINNLETGKHSFSLRSLFEAEENNADIDKVRCKLDYNKQIWIDSLDINAE